jgi:hypothetical protein
MSLPSMRLCRFSLPLVVLSTAVVMTLGTGSARAQGITPFEMGKIVRAGNADRASIDKINTYFGWFFKQFQNPPSGDTLPALRKDFGNIVGRVGDNAAHRYVNNLVYAQSKNIVADRRYSPAARYNAMLLVADLNQSDATGNIKPYPPSLDLMKLALGVPPDSAYAFLKPAALVGIRRFAQEKGIPPQDVPKLTAQLLTMVNETNPPPGRSASAHNFIRRGAAGVLAALGNLGPDNAVLKAFESIVLDPNTRLTMRCEVMQCMGDLKYSPQAQDQLQHVANLIGHQTIEVCRQELERAEAEDRDPSRRILMYALYSAGVGMRGVYDAAAANRSGEAYAFISKVRGKLSDGFRQLDDTTKTPDEQIAASLETLLDEIQGTLLAKPAVPEPLAAAGPAQPEDVKPVENN